MILTFYLPTSSFHGEIAANSGIRVRGLSFVISTTEESLSFTHDRWFLPIRTSEHASWASQTGSYPQ